MNDPSPIHSIMQALTAITDAIDVSLRQGGLVMLVLLLVIWNWLRGRRR